MQFSHSCLPFLSLYLLIILVPIFAENNETSTEIEIKLKRVAPPLVASPDLTTPIIFPQSYERKFPIGDPIDLLVGLSNNGDSSFNVTIISASLVHPQDLSIYVQNFSRRHISHILDPSSQATFSYTFFPDPMLEPRDFRLIASVYYHSLLGDGEFCSVVFNGTIILEDVSETLDIQTLFTYVGLFGMIGLIGYVIIRSFSSMKTKRSRKASGTGFMDSGNGERNQAAQNEWLVGTSAEPNKSKQQKLFIKHRKQK